MSEIVISEFMEPDSVKRLSSVAQTHYDPGLAERPDDLAAMVGGARALIVRNRTKVTEAVLAAAGSSLVSVGRLGVGLDNIDLDACRERNVHVRPATGANDLSVVEYVLTAALVLTRGAWFSSPSVAAGNWPRQAMIGSEIAGKTMGLIGFGSIARGVAIKARALGMRVLAHDPFVAADDPAWENARLCALPELLVDADVVSLHVPLVETTRHLLDADAFARMKPGAVLVNAARGGVVDEGALVEALRDGRLGGAALDVFEKEPLDAEAGLAFADLPNLILTPHIAGLTEESNGRVCNLVADLVLKDLGLSA
ncbi:UNVERIFIED_ORG: (S)-sulfolactate dehydrogenase [Martelella mediterranea]